MKKFKEYINEKIHTASDEKIDKILEKCKNKRTFHYDKKLIIELGLIIDVLQHKSKEFIFICGDVNDEMKMKIDKIIKDGSYKEIKE